MLERADTVVRDRRGATSHRRNGAMRRRLAIIGVVGLGLLGACSSGTSSADTTVATAPPNTYVANATVVGVVDGDTIDVTVDGTEERVRLIGIDTPETVKPGTPVECCGPEASGVHQGAAARRARRVYLERDLVARDDYGRLLAYVFRDRRRVRQPATDRQRVRPHADDRAEPRLPRRVRAGRRAGRRRPDSASGRTAPDSVTGDERRLVAHARAGRTPRLSRRTTSWSSSPATTSAVCHAANDGVYAALRDGVATCASLMVPAPWARDAARQRTGRPTTSACTSRSTASTTPTAWGRSPTPRRCSPARAASRATSTTCGSTPIRRRCCASAGPRSSGPSPGASTSPTSPRTCRRSRCGPSSSTSTSSWPSSSGCPIRLPSTITAEQAGFPFRQLAAEEGRAVPRPLRPRLAGRQPRPRLPRRSPTLQPGVTEIHVQPAIDTPEVRALSPHAEAGSTTSTC